MKASNINNISKVQSMASSSTNPSPKTFMVLLNQIYVIHHFDHNNDYCNFRFCFSAIYCIDCFADLKNVCAVCSNSIELDGSDASEER